MVYLLFILLCWSFGLCTVSIIKDKVALGTGEVVSSVKLLVWKCVLGSLESMWETGFDNLFVIPFLGRWRQEDSRIYWLVIWINWRASSSVRDLVSKNKVENHGRWPTLTSMLYREHTCARVPTYTCTYTRIKWSWAVVFVVDTFISLGHIPRHTIIEFVHLQLFRVLPNFSCKNLHFKWQRVTATHSFFHHT